MLIPIDEVVVFDVTTHHPSTGAITDADSGPTYDVFEEATDTPILDDQTLTKRTSLTGHYRGSFTASAANGFEAGKWYSVVATAVVNTVTAKCVALHFRAAPAETAAGVPQVRVSAIADGLLVAATFAAGAFDAVWSVVARVLTAGTNIVLAKGVGVTGFTDLSAAQVNTEADTAIVDAALATAANLAIVAGYLDTEVAAIKAKTDTLPASPANEATLTTIAGYLDTEIAAIKAKTDNLPSDPADQSALEAAILAAWTTALTESYSADGAAPTPAQALFLILQRLTEFAIAGTTTTIKKLDGTTTAATLTHDSATEPTTSTRAT
jgi:hypothetical protein